MRILAMSGSTRTDSTNKQLLATAVEEARREGHEVTVVDLKGLALPLYDGDVEAQGYPLAAARLKTLLREHEALLIASPEYNGSVSAVLKNAIDWASRPPREGVFDGHTAILMSAVPGRGGYSGLQHLRDILTRLGVSIQPDSLVVRQSDLDEAETRGLIRQRFAGLKLAA